MRRLALAPLLVALFAQAAPPSPPSAPKPPVAKKTPKDTPINGYVLHDDYGWLREKKNPEVAAYLNAENAYADAVMKPTAELQERLYQEMVGHVKETDERPPYPDHGWLYYSRTEKGKQYPIHCRRKDAPSSPEQVTLDMNELAKGQKYLGLGRYVVSDDGNLLAYSIDNTGFRQYTLHVKDLRTGKVLLDSAEKVGSVVWAADNKTLFYTVEDAAKRQYRVYRHLLGTPARSDALVFEEKDERFDVGALRSRDRALVFIVSGSKLTTEARFLPADRPTGAWTVVEPRQQGVEYYVDHRGDEFYIVTNDKGRTFRLVKTKVAAPGQRNWTEVIPTRPDVMLSAVEVFQDFYAVFEREGGLPRLRVVDFATGKSTPLQFSEPTYSVSLGQNLEFATHKLRYLYQSMVSPSSTYDYDVTEHRSILLKQDEVPGGFDQSRYASEWVFATARDGTKVPVSIVYRKDLKKADGSNPLYLYGYGSYGISMPAFFEPTRLVLLDRGVVYAIAHIRGGGEFGDPWHDAGKMMTKKNTFTDFIDVAEFLVANKYGAKDRLAIEGGSAGGLLMGAVTNLRPDLFKAVVSKVPFVDVMNTMLDESLPLTVGEFEEWGNPKEKAAFEYMRTYSPYDNLEAKAYPAMLVKTSFNDSQVMYWEPAKYVARMRALKTDGNVLLLKTNMAAGHGGSSGRYDRLRDIAFDDAFVLTQLGVEKPSAVASGDVK